MVDNTVPSDAGDQSSVDRARFKKNLEEDARTEHYKEVLGTYEGRAVIWDILSQCGIYDAGLLPPSDSAYRDGKRYIGVTLIEEIEYISPNSYSLMRQEATERSHRNKNG